MCLNRFICIEPWFGHADYEDFKDKEGTVSLLVGEEFNYSYKIYIIE